MTPQTASKARAPSIVGLVPACNGGRLLGRCPASLGFCDGTVAVDSPNTDATVDIATAAGATQKLAGGIIHHRYSNFREQRGKRNSHARQGADALKTKGRSGGGPRFFKLHALKPGALDGRAGFLDAVHGSSCVLLKHVRVAEGDWSPRP